MLASCRLERMGKNIRRNWKEQVTFNINGKFLQKSNSKDITVYLESYLLTGFTNFQFYFRIGYIMFQNVS